MQPPAPSWRTQRRSILAMPLAIGLAGMSRLAETREDGGEAAAMETTIEHLSPEGMHRNPAFSQAVVVANPGRTIYIAGAGIAGTGTGTTAAISAGSTAGSTGGCWARDGSSAGASSSDLAVVSGVSALAGGLAGKVLPLSATDGVPAAGLSLLAAGLELLSAGLSRVDLMGVSTGFAAGAGAWLANT